MKRVLLLLLCVIIYLEGFSNSQEPRVDSIPIPHILLKEVIVRGKFKGKRYYQRRDRLSFNVRKVYPYARIAAQHINAINNKIEYAATKKEKENIIKTEYSELMASFKKPLMKLSYTQGRILVRLIYRETNNSAFAHIKEYRGTFNAYFWQSVALLFGNNLKADYDPQGDDKEIEEVVQSILAGQ